MDNLRKNVNAFNSGHEKHPLAPDMTGFAERVEHHNTHLEYGAHVHPVHSNITRARKGI